MDNFHNFNTPMLNIDSYTIKEREKHRENLRFSKILEKCHNKIRITAQNVK